VITSAEGSNLQRRKAGDGRTREGVVVVVPGLSERRQREPKDVARLVVDVEAPGARKWQMELTPSHVVDEKIRTRPPHRRPVAARRACQ